MTAINVNMVDTWYLHKRLNTFSAIIRPTKPSNRVEIEGATPLSF